MAHINELAPAIRNLYPEQIRAFYEIHEWHNATAILRYIHAEEWQDLMTVLEHFRLRRSDIIRGGGNKSAIARSLDEHFLRFGWKKETFDTTISITSRVAKSTSVYDVPTHEVDCFKGRVALEVEWNNKDPFFDRDLNNFRLLFELRAIDVGIIVTRSDTLQTIFKQLGRAGSFGESTTHMRKLIPKADGGGAGGCPVIAFGISPALYVEDEDTVSAGAIARAELIEHAETLRTQDTE